MLRHCTTSLARPHQLPPPRRHPHHRRPWRHLPQAMAPRCPHHHTWHRTTYLLPTISAATPHLPGHCAAHHLALFHSPQPWRRPFLSLPRRPASLRVALCIGSGEIRRFMPPWPDPAPPCPYQAGPLTARAATATTERCPRPSSHRRTSPFVLQIDGWKEEEDLHPKPMCSSPDAPVAVRSASECGPSAVLAVCLPRACVAWLPRGGARRELPLHPPQRWLRLDALNPSRPLVKFLVSAVRYNMSFAVR